MKFRTTFTLVAIGWVAALLVSGSAAAVDGVNEINDTSVIAAGGYPFVIGAPGSYVLTGNLTPPAGIGALVVAVSEVEIDLNGFTLFGAGGGAGDGIAGGLPGLTVENGTILGFGGAGILGGPEMKVLKTRISFNAVGIAAAATCVVVENIVVGNTGLGVDALECKIENNIIAGNGDSGISGGSNVIVNNKINGNGATAGGGGILSPGGSTIQENVMLGNFGFGISDSPGAPPAPVPAPPGIAFPPAPSGSPPNNIMKNVVDGGPPGVGIGIYSNNSALITDNTVTNWAADGIVCGIQCTIRGNQVHGNNFSGGSNGGVTVGPGSTVNDNSIGFNAGVGLLIDPTAGWTNNTLMANGTQDMSLFVPIGPPSAAPHPTSGFFNLCSGAPGPVPGFGPGACP